MALRSAVLTCLLATLAACAAVNEPDFVRLYSETPFETRRDTPPAEPLPPLVVIPGLLGSRLVSAATGREIWPGSLGNVVLGRYRELALPVSPEQGADELVPSGIAETAFGVDFYGRLIGALEQYGRYVRSEPGRPVTDRLERRLYVFAYDWRQDNVVTVGRLAAFIEQIRADYADPALKVDVIAHSMGGLLARYFLRYGTEDVLDDNELRVTWAGAAIVNKVILLGTPNLGAVSAIEGFVSGQKVGLRRIPPEVVATLPSTYQLFPHRIIDWLYTTRGQVLDRDQFDTDTWRRLQWNIFAPEVRARVVESRGADYATALEAHFERSIERARRFSWSLTVCPNYDERLQRCADEVAEPPLRLVVFGGNCDLTPARIVIEESRRHGSVPRFTPGAVRDRVDGIDYDRLMLDPGDGTVTKPSLLARDALSPYTPRHEYSYFPLDHAFLLCSSHARLTGNPHFQANLLDVLLTRARPWELHKDHAYDAD